MKMLNAAQRLADYYMEWLFPAEPEDDRPEEVRLADAQRVLSGLTQFIARVIVMWRLGTTPWYAWSVQQRDAWK